MDKVRKPMVVIIAETSLPPVSRANLRLYYLAKALKNNFKVQVNMVTPSPTPFNRKSVYLEGIFMNQYWGFDVLLYSIFRLPIRMWHFFATICSIIYLERFFRKNGGIDVIHAWNPLAGLAAVIVGKIIKKPVFIDFTDFYSDIARTDMRAAFNLLRKIERYILKNAAEVFVVSEEVVKILESQGIKKEKVHIIPDGTDKNLFNSGVNGNWIRLEYDLPDNPILIYHGDIKYDDGVDILFEAFAVVLKSRPDARLIVLGGGGGYYRRILRLLDELDIRKSVMLSGWVTHQEVPQYIAASDIGVMPMRASLNHNCYLSFKLFEYWGVGKPVVSTRLEAISKIVKEGMNGLLVESENPQALTEAILKLINDPERAKKMGAEGRKLVEQKYNWENLMKEEIAFYKKYLS